MATEVREAIVAHCADDDRQKPIHLLRPRRVVCCLVALQTVRPAMPVLDVTKRFNHRSRKRQCVAAE